MSGNLLTFFPLPFLKWVCKSQQKVRQRYFSRKKLFFIENKFAQKPIMFLYLSGCVTKSENQGLFEYQLEKLRYKYWKCANEPQSYLKILFSWNNPYHGMLLPGHPGGVTRYWHCFWTPADISQLGQQGDLYTQTILETPKRSKFQNYYMDLRYPTSSMICAIDCYKFSNMLRP